MSIHIYRARDQKATRYRDDIMGVNRWVTNAGNKLFWADCCVRRRPARNLIVHVYYDCTRYWCVSGKGCKNLVMLAAKKRREFKNRSAGQKARWLRDIEVQKG